MAKSAKPKPLTSKPDDHKTLSTTRRRQLEYDLLRELSHRIPQKLLREFTGRQPKQIKDQAERYQLDFNGRIWDLEKFLRSVFDLLARIAPHYGRWMRTKDEALAAADQRTPTERWQIARARRAEFDLERLHGQYIAREDMHEALGAFASILRDAGGRLQRQCGPAAYEIHQEALESAVQAVRRVLKDDHGDNHKPS